MYLILSTSSVELLAICATVFLALVGTLIYSISRNGWINNGYFTLPSVLLIVAGLFIVFQALGSMVMIAAVGTQVEQHPLAALSINGLAELIVLLCGTVYLSSAAARICLPYSGWKDSMKLRFKLIFLLFRSSSLHN